MKLTSQGDFLTNEFVTIKDQWWLDRQRISGKVVSQILSLLENLVKDKTTKSLLELDKIAEEFILQNSCTPCFKGYKGFPNSVCISVNDQLVHGIPTDYKLKEHDVVSFDLGAEFKGVISDAARTIIFGQPKSEQHTKLIQATKECFDKAVNAIKIGNRLGCIGNAIYKHARENNFSVVIKYGGHGIDISKDGKGKPHAQPFVCNKANIDEGIRICAGMTLAIEPLLVIGSSNNTRTGSDNWTVYTDNISAHYEDTIFIHKDKVEIMTQQ